ncbi:uncharacterized protein LOC141621336 [Silene latifolia]|uniref:uncharacterized protein LOC141621336 n=1 Tax=Silene latifolia TaxID=37657 RepID=UPI003D76DAEC
MQMVLQSRHRIMRLEIRFQACLIQGMYPSKWKNIYASAFDGTHSYLFRQHEKHIGKTLVGMAEVEAVIQEMFQAPHIQILLVICPMGDEQICGCQVVLSLRPFFFLNN